MATDFNLMGWLDTGTTATRDATVYIDNAGYQELLDARKRLARLEADDNEDPAARLERVELRDQIGQLQHRLEASKMVWTVRALSNEEVSEALEAVPPPVKPLRPPGVLTEKTERDLDKKFTGYVAAARAADRDRKLWVIERATEKIVTPSGEADGVTLDELRAIEGRPHGFKWIDAVYQAVEDATSQDVAPDIPR